MHSKAFVVHVCKNSKLPDKGSNHCENSWVDVDKTNAQTYPPAWKYCVECEKKGFKNPKTRNISRTPEQIEAFKERMAKYRANKRKTNV